MDCKTYDNGCKYALTHHNNLGKIDVFGILKYIREIRSAVFYNGYFCEGLELKTADSLLLQIFI